MDLTADDPLLQRLLEQCRLEIANKKPAHESLRRIRDILDSAPSGSDSLLLDVLTALNADLSSSSSSGGSDANHIRAFLAGIAEELVPQEVLSLELSALGADDSQARSRIVKSKTRMYFKQLKFNLLREESEGYGKLIAEVLSVQRTTTADQLLVVIESLIGQFNLDPNRVLDLILDGFEHSLQHRELFVALLRKFKVEPGELCKILSLKFIFCQTSEHTPMDLYRAASILCQAGLVEPLALFAMVAPAQPAVVADHKRLLQLVKARCAKATTISTGQLASEAALTAAATAMSGPNMEGPEPVGGLNVIPSVSFSAAAASQEAEDRKIAGANFDDLATLAKNQKLGLICALLEHGAWPAAKELMDRLPDQYAMGLSRRIAKAVANLIGFSVDSFYRQKCPDWHSPQQGTARQKDSWERFTHPVPQVTNWASFASTVGEWALHLGPHIGVRHEVAVKLIRLIAKYYKEHEGADGAISPIIMDIFDCCLVPATSLLDSNFAYTEELWLCLSQMPYQIRFWLYGRWKTVHTARCWELAVKRSKVLGMAKYALKRLSKENARVVGRQLGKLAHTYPAANLSYVIDKVQDFQNFIGPVVESLKFLSNLELDVLSYCLIESLADPAKAAYKTTDVAFSPWLQSLASFAAAVFRRYGVDFAGLLQYIANQLKDGNSLDLIVLREVVANISGVEAGTDITQEHLEALCGFDWLRETAGYATVAKVNKRATGRLRDALLQKDLLQSLCILIAQQKGVILYKDYKEYPLKLTTYMLDQCQETFVQFHHFVRSLPKADIDRAQLPPVQELLADHHLPIEAAMFLTRSNYIAKINADYEGAKKTARELQKGKLDEEQKFELYRKAFEGMWRELENALVAHYPTHFFGDLPSGLYSVFWLLSASDLLAPTEAYGRELDKCRKELAELTAQSSESSSRARRNAKEEERLKALEQKIADEMAKQVEHVQRIKRILAAHAVDLFTVAQNRMSQMLRFFQVCILPRVVFSEVDAIYCARLCETLHANKTELFQTMVFYDKIFIDITPFFCALTEREANCLGRFCCMSLDVIMRWHASKENFEAECEGYPGCMTRVRQPTGGGEADVGDSGGAFSYAFFRSACFKWHVKLCRALSDILSSNNYVLSRNALTFMLKVLPNFPILQVHYNTIEKSVTILRDKEKGKRHDLNLLASSYLVKLQKRGTPLRDTKSFYDAKLTAKTKPAGVAPVVVVAAVGEAGDAASAGASRKRAAATTDAKSSSSSEQRGGRSAITAPTMDTPPQTPTSDGGGSGSKKRRGER